MTVDIEFASHILELTLAEYSAIRSVYWSGIYNAVIGYLLGSGNVLTFKYPAKRAIAIAQSDTSDTAWQDGGGKLPLDRNAADFVIAAQNAEFGYIDSLAQTLKMFRDEESNQPAYAVEAEMMARARADGYAKSLDALYNNVKALAAGNRRVMLTFTGEDGMESCTDCQRYKGQRHTAGWWVRRDAVPPSRSFECRGYRCEHVLVDDNGNLFSI